MSITFEELGLSKSICQAIAELGHEEPTAIQARTIPLMQTGTDVIAQAQTGTGKTAAFALPILGNLQASTRHPQALILTPTRELAMQVAEAFHTYGKYQALAVLPIYGGQPIEQQLRALKKGVHVVVGTPGRLLDHIRRGTLALDQVRTVVLDEADEMLDMGFIEDIEAILRETPAERQTALFSATLSNSVVQLAQRYMRDPRRVTIETEQMTVPQVRQVYYEVGRRDKFEVLARILDYEKPASAIIFCRTKSEVDAVGERLAARAFPAATLHGDLNQAQRDRVMERFRSGQVELLVATDVAARGLDIEHVSHVINYDIPFNPEMYVHRIGRTGRAGRTGCAITLAMPRDQRLLQVIQRTTGATIQRLGLPTLADVVTRRREAFKETLREAVAGGGLESYLALAEELSADYSPTDLAAAALKLLLGETLQDSQDKLAAGEADEQRADRKRRTWSHERYDIGTDTKMQRLYLDMGRADRIRPGDIVGAIANEANIPGRAIGIIEMFEHCSSVEVPGDVAERVLHTLNRTTLRGRKIAASTTKPRLSGGDKPSKQRRRAREILATL